MATTSTVSRRIADVETKRFYRANSTVCRMLGYSEEELLQRSIMDIHPPETLAATFQSFCAKAAGNLCVRENAPVLRKDGSVFHADIVSNAVTYRGRPCLLGIFRDVTERWRSQEALQRERRTLQHMLESSDHERQLIAYEIHDGLAQYPHPRRTAAASSGRTRLTDESRVPASLQAWLSRLRAPIRVKICTDYLRCRPARPELNSKKPAPLGSRLDF
jgi:PAS domain S-box-containing protein